MKLSLPLSLLLPLLLLLLCSDVLLRHRPPLVLAAPTSNLEQTTAAQSVRQTRRPSYVVFHPPTRSCVIRKSLDDSLGLGPCDQSDSWQYTPQKFLVVAGTYFCLQPVQSGKPAELGIVCSAPGSSWDITANANVQTISAKRPGGGGSLCLDVDAASNALVTNPCLCLSSKSCDPGSQWFQFNLRSQVQGSEAAAAAYTLHSTP